MKIDSNKICMQVLANGTLLFKLNITFDFKVASLNIIQPSMNLDANAAWSNKAKNGNEYKLNYIKYALHNQLLFTISQ